MSDDFLSRFRDEPRREFAEDLKRRLREIEVAEGEPAAGRRGRAVPVLAGAAIAATVALAFTLPRAGGRAQLPRSLPREAVRGRAGRPGSPGSSGAASI